MSAGNGKAAASPLAPIRGLGPDPIMVNQLNQVVQNTLMISRQWSQALFDPRRDIDDECGYVPAGSGISTEVYKQLYDREPIATRVVQVLPNESWQVSPEVYETDDNSVDTPFEQAWKELPKDLSGGSSYYNQEEGSPIWEYLRRADVLSGIGHFGILLLGIDDGLRLDQPVEGSVEFGWGDKKYTDSSIKDGEEENFEDEKLKEKGQKPLSNEERQVLNQWIAQRARRKQAAKTRQRVHNEYSLYGYGPSSVQERSGQGPQTGDYASGYKPLGTDQQYFGVQFGPSEHVAEKPSKTKRRLLFLRAFDESLVQVVRYEWDVRNPRFGQPVMYRVTLNDPREQHTGVGLPLATVFVHWSRVIHLADNLGSSEIFGVPRMRPVLNPLFDIRKVRGGSAEMYWRGAFPGISFETHPQLGGDVQVDASGMRDQMENYFNGLQRYLLSIGMAAKPLAPQVVDPTPQINAQLEAICIQLGIPIRVFKGSERGELASSQDDASWNDRLRHRQNMYITPRIIIPFIDRLILLGVLPEPKAQPSEAPANLAPGEEGSGMTESEGDEFGFGGEDEEAPEGAEAAEAPEGEGDEEEPEEDFTSRPPGERPRAKPVSVPRLPARNRHHGSGPAIVRLYRKAKRYIYNAELDNGPEEAPGGIEEVEVEEDAGTAVQSELGYCVKWPDLDSLGLTDKASIFQQRVTALAAYVSGQLEALMDPIDFLVHEGGYTEDEARSIVENASAHQEEMMAAQQPLMDEHGMKPEAPEGFLDPEQDEIEHQRELEKIEAQGEAGVGQSPFGGGPPQIGGPPQQGNFLPKAPGGPKKPPFVK